MILILSQSQFEATTEEVIDWIDYLGGNYVRINGDDFYNGTVPFHYSLNRKGQPCITLKGIPMEDINVVWYRRWINGEQFYTKEMNRQSGVSHSDMYKFKAALFREVNTANAALFSQLDNVTWIPNRGSLNKLDTLKKAGEAGLRIPETFITNNKSELRNFYQKHNKRLITKPISEVFGIVYKNQWWHFSNYMVNPEDLDNLPETIFPMLTQEYIEKEYEIRCFYLMGKMYAMAMFSQKDERTRVDFRRMDFKKPTRRIPYDLPEALAGKLQKLFQAVALTTGSVDLIKAKDGNYYFLEINPVGQLGMTSIPTNFMLEKEIARTLITIDNNR